MSSGNISLYATFAYSSSLHTFDNFVNLAFGSERILLDAMNVYKYNRITVKQVTIANGI